MKKIQDIIHVDKRNLDAFRCLPKSLDYVEDSEGAGVLCGLCSNVLIITLSFLCTLRQQGFIS